MGACLLLFLAKRGNGFSAAILLIVGIVDLASALALVAQRRWAWGLCAFVNASVLCFCGIYLGSNILLYLLGDKRYQDSPGTIFVAVLNCAIVSAPFLAASGLLWRERSNWNTTVRRDELTHAAHERHNGNVSPLHR
jgi:hypothetical protein